MRQAPWTRRHFLQQTALASSALLLPTRAAAQTAPTGDALLTTPLGKLRGERNGPLRVFRGVPFAEPPIGPLRFGPPHPKQPWTGVRDATHFAAASLQPGDRDIPQSEDCLYLNVWAPDTTHPLPVFVWIHGGGFTGGESFAPIFDGTVFAQQEIVVVTVAYRLGVLGFLDMETLLGAAYAGSANNALRDLIEALRWVQANIAAFGGDPHRVTIGGESAGAKLTDLLMAIPQAKPLFAGMISESGGAERIWPKNNAQAVGEGFGKLWRDSAPGRSNNTLTTTPARDLIQVQDTLMRTWPQHFPLRCELDGTLFPTLPITTIAAGSARGKRLLIGSNRDESALFLGPHPEKPITAADLGNMSLATFNEIYAGYAALYPDMPEAQRRIRAVTAEEYWVPSIRVADAAASSGAHVWMYELDYARDGGRYKGEAFHSEDLGLVWNKPSPEYAPAEAQLASQVNTAWAAFLRGETPAAPGLPPWPAYNAGTRPTMLLDRTSQVQNAPQAAELALWHAL